MHINDDAFHHVWCIYCLKYCYKKPACTARLPKTRVKRSMRHRRLHNYPEYVLSFQVGNICVLSQLVRTLLTAILFDLQIRRHVNFGQDVLSEKNGTLFTSKASRGRDNDGRMSAQRVLRVVTFAYLLVPLPLYISHS